MTTRETIPTDPKAQLRAVRRDLRILRACVDADPERIRDLERQADRYMYEIDWNGRNPTR